MSLARCVASTSRTVFSDAALTCVCRIPPQRRRLHESRRLYAEAAVSQASSSAGMPPSMAAVTSDPIAAAQSLADEVLMPTSALSEGDIKRLSSMRNIGISAHVDSGKVRANSPDELILADRLLYYTGRIKAIHEVRGKDEVGAKMDSMELEREKGITIQSAATFCDWSVQRAAVADALGEYKINIIDTPGHVDFTIEVERALRVLDGAVLVLCAVSGVQSQSITVDRQMRRYNVPRLTFVNKMDRAGANPFRVVDQIRTKLRLAAALIQLPIGAEDGFEGVIDLVRMISIRNRGEKGIEVVESTDIPANLVEQANARRSELIETLADVDDEIAELYLEEKPVSSEQLHAAVRRATVARRFTPVLVGTALGNTSVQPLLDAVCSYLPAPNEVAPSSLTAMDVSQPGHPPLQLVPATRAPLAALAFKLEEGRFGQLTYIRVYQGTVSRGMFLTNIRTGKRVKVPKLVRMHSNEMEEVEKVGAGEICALYGIDCASGDTFTDGSSSISMTPMYVPEPVISLSIRPKGQETPAFSRAINRFQREDPTFRVHVDSESGETIISGMGELHLEIYVERMKREYSIDCVTGKPQVAFRETITRTAAFAYTHKKQSGGAGQFGRVVGRLEPMERDEDTGADTAFENTMMGTNISEDYVPAIRKGFEDSLKRGLLTNHPVTGCRFVLEDGAMHPVDSSELAFRSAAQGAFREAFMNAGPVVLEPIMKVEVTAPIEFQGPVIGGVNQRKGMILDSDIREADFTVIAEIALNDLFGYSSTLRASTQGKGEFSAEFVTYRAVMGSTQKEMIEAAKRFVK